MESFPSTNIKNLEINLHLFTKASWLHNCKCVDMAVYISSKMDKYLLKKFEQMFENGNIFDIIIAVYKKSDGEIPIKLNRAGVCMKRIILL